MPGPAWEAWETQRLGEMLSTGLSASEMQIGNRTAAAIQNKASRHGLVGDGIARRPWTQDDEQVLRRLVRHGWTAAAIIRDGSVLEGYTRNAIQKKIGRLSLANRERSRRAKQAVRLPLSQLERFHTFLWAHAARCTPEQIALLWNQEHTPAVGRRRVVYHLEKLGIKRPWADVMKMPFSKAKQRRLSRRSLASRAVRWNLFREQQEQSLRDLARRRLQAARRGVKKPRQRVCRDCRRRWPAVEPFFVLYTKKVRAGRRTYVGRICRLCRNRRRRESQAKRRVLLPR